MLSSSALTATTPAERFGSRPAASSELRAKVESRLGASALALLRYEPALEGVARTLSETWVTTEQPPAMNVMAWLHWRAGVVGRPAGHWVIAGEGNLSSATLDAALATWAGALNQRTSTPRAWAVVRFQTGGGEMAQALVLADDSVELEVPRKATAGQALELSGRLKVPAEQLTLFIEDDERAIRQVRVPLDEVGRFSLTVPGPATAGRRYLELVRRPPSRGEDQEWTRAVALVPLLVDVPEPQTPELNVAEPKPNPQDVGSWPEVVRAAWDQRRGERGLPPLQASSGMRVLAGEIAKAAAEFTDAPPANNLVQRVNQHGVIAREVVAHTAQLEYLEELMWDQWRRPSIRQTILAGLAPAYGAEFVKGADGEYTFAQIFAHPVGLIDVASDVAALRARFQELQVGAKKPATKKDAELDAALEKVITKKCTAGGALEKTDVQELLRTAKLQGSSNWVTTHSSRLLPEDLAGVVGDLPQKTATHVAIAACQYQATEKQGLELVVVLLVDAQPR